MSTNILTPSTNPTLATILDRQGAEVSSPQVTSAQSGTAARMLPLLAVMSLAACGKDIAPDTGGPQTCTSEVNLIFSPGPWAATYEKDLARTSTRIRGFDDENPSIISDVDWANYDESSGSFQTDLCIDDLESGKLVVEVSYDEAVWDRIEAEEPAANTTETELFKYGCYGLEYGLATHGNEVTATFEGTELANTGETCWARFEI